MSDYQNYAIQVTRTSVVTINVLARDLDSAKRNALSKASSKGYASEDLRTEALAVWPEHEPEDDFIIATDRGYEVRRGWFWEAGLDNRSISMTSAQVWGENPDADARDLRTMHRAFDGYQEPNETIFNITRRYGFASRIEGDPIWSNVVNTQAQAEREARHDLNDRARRKRDRDFFALVDETIQKMREPGNGNALLRLKGGRWTVKSMLGDRSPTDCTHDDVEWSVPPTVVGALQADEKVKVLGQFTRSQQPFHVGLTDKVLAPF